MKPVQPGSQMAGWLALCGGRIIAVLRNAESAASWPTCPTALLGSSPPGGRYRLQRAAGEGGGVTHQQTGPSTLCYLLLQLPPTHRATHP